MMLSLSVMNNTKQIIVLRKFPNLRTGKYVSQACHASMAFLTKYSYLGCGISEDRENSIMSLCLPYNIHRFADEIQAWLASSYRKIVCYVETEEELMELYNKAVAKNLIVNLIEDNGATEFKGQKTRTAIAIGPHWDERFEGLTDHLPLM
jgi:peptidyl-tRNA hydrolase, PTH2 family